MELKGTVKKIGEIQTFASGFQKQEVVLTTEEQYPQTIVIDFLKDKIDLLKGLKVGDGIKVGINIGGREWTNTQGETKYFNSITGWRIEKVGNVPTKKNEPFLKGEMANEFNDLSSDLLSDEDDLPF